MIALQTIFVYSLLTLAFYLLCKKASEENKWRYVVAALFVYSFVFAIRYGVGRDYVSYHEMYLDALNGIYEGNTERGFYWMQRLFATLRLHPVLYFGFIAFFQIYFIFRSLKTQMPIFPYLALSFMLGGVWLGFSNTIRQVLAFSLFAYSLTFAEQRKWVLYYIFVLFAVSMHSSAIVLIVIYPLFSLISRIQIKNTFLRLIIILVAVIIGLSPFLKDYLGLIDRILFISGYEVYQRDGYREYAVAEEITHWGLGAVIILTQNILIVANQNRIREFYRSKRVDFLSSLFYIGILGNYLFAGSTLFNRMFGYFYWFQFVMSAYILFFAKRTGRKALFYLIIWLYILTFMALLYRMFDNDVAYYFYWQSSMHRVHD